MPLKTINARLSKLIDELQSQRFLESRGIGNEIAYYIFDYDPEVEPIIQNFLENLPKKLSVEKNIQVREINLYLLMVDILEQRNFLQKAFALEQKKGSAILSNTVRPILRPEKIIEYLLKIVTGEEDLILLTGVGSSWPLLRSHTILNNLHPVLDQTPVVMFFPGTYDGKELRLFNELKDDNYYRAFPLVPRQEFQV